MKDLLEKLINAHGISGYEEQVREIIAAEIAKYVDTVSVGKMGGLIAHKKGKGPKMMLAAHMDEIGLMIKSIDDDGKIRFSPIGGIDVITIVGQRVHMHVKNSKTIMGVITTDDIVEGNIVSDMPKIKDMYVDTGMTKEELTNNGIKIGTTMGLEQETGYLGKEEIIFGKALDDRIGCYILLELAKKISKKNIDADVYFVFTVQEEIAFYGAVATAYRVEPDYAVVVDVTNVLHGIKEIGKGPCIGLKDSTMITNKKINDYLIKLAEKISIPLQFDVGEESSSDAFGISMTKGGIPTTVLGPCIKNIHSTICVAHDKDIENTIALLHELVMNPKIDFGSS
jgi:endoglucanase